MSGVGLDCSLIPGVLGPSTACLHSMLITLMQRLETIWNRTGFGRGIRRVYSSYRLFGTPSRLITASNLGALCSANIRTLERAALRRMIIQKIQSLPDDKQFAATRKSFEVSAQEVSAETGWGKPRSGIVRE
jgi:hypothetical protein